MKLQGKKILICISGGIAAYKINYLIRDFIKKGAEVQVLMTPSAEQFVSKLTLSTLSKNPVYSDFYSENGTWNNHVKLALWADVILMAPCTANTLSKMVHGMCDNLVLATYMSAKCPVFIAPAMDLDMYQHPSTKLNLELAEDFGHHLIPAEDGELASGLSGVGRMAEPETISQIIEDFFNSNRNLEGKTVLITAGPTYEAIDPVRFIGNHSSGKMGFSLAEEAANRGAKVIMISGPSSEKTNHQNIEVHRVTSAKEMFAKVFEYYENADIAIASAAVADYAPKEIAQEKIKKNDDSLTIELVKNPDILKTMGERKTKQFLVGFALETQNEEENAKGKLQKKNLDMIVLNSLRDEGAGFKGTTNKIKILTKSTITEFPLKSKEHVAKDILNFVEDQILK
ncbi:MULTISPECIES: bifunctional phosphopantothenoylcysteine decarboxylase/phosphopantothenate--cysteine ligase CoaBC [unclassified Kaistella]|uniref:bifunctional phosphopantothenoylcysteine decarboxylase/phosphopantothenate--cysteine ligase CoaBC n=1 Tax=unclassified Kaistella TaxID=2762626 RepID=UPI0027361E85|nr:MULTISPECIES: bifunctional phosphopantothenoylcysteine decarboxylase/phosphopantothenate--cysteine ligase CoaBC [unclassified Kaistella]MDP2452838.1 bifunctional phosphopantothenoylcysteine decarboxylase/phosphopantothenate--cysteine ligase CoaBC [Kaistella sp. SH11-4b]MDP2455747.1 bifunctional phosphopantothenoylcysteine decarboxylase/phosphopantothenate--cysteine ligase CoaBC [Kaistella sp. SH40-3]MDP2458651.1 bifunctional phosphopantothenoylcysteine decarboxylase/phosphopantothenate--cyste